MTRPVLNTKHFMLGFVAFVPASALLAVFLIPGAAQTLSEAQESSSIEDWLAVLDPAYAEFEEEVEEYIEEAGEDDQPDPDDEQHEQLIEELNSRVGELEAEVERFERMTADAGADPDRIERLNEQIAELESARFSEDDFTQVRSYAEAVRPAIPLVRDFAVNLAGEYPGSYYRRPNERTPGPTGIQQVLAIHEYVIAEWRYVNDPFVIRDNYYSPAERTIALGLGGDCVDFSILIASAVEAVGGRARILHGTCSEGAHAWPEVHIGDRSAWREALRVLDEWFPGRNIEHLEPDNSNDYWLSLDWQVGVFTCGDNATVQYESP